MKKIIIVLISIFIFSGCTVFYEINIDENLMVNENISFYEENIIFNENSPIQKSEYSVLLDQIKKKARDNNYEFIDKSSGNNIDLSLKKTIHFKNFKDPILLEGKYKNFKTMCSEKLCSISASVIENEILGDGNILYYNIGISVPYEVVKHNASHYDKKNNAFYWYYSPVDDAKNIEIVFKNGGEKILDQHQVKEKTKLIFWVIISVLFTTTIGAIGYKIYINNKASL